MQYYDKLMNLIKIKNALQDEESLIVFKARINFMCTRNKRAYYEEIDRIPKRYYSKELEAQLKNSDKYRKIIVYGYNQFAKDQKRVIELCGYRVSYWCDKDKKIIGQTLDGILVISIKELVEKYPDALVIISTQKYKDEMCQDLINNNYPASNIYCPKYGTLVAVSGMQYFDVFNPSENEIFIDAGAYDGKTIFDYLTWAGNHHCKVYSLEPIKEMYDNIQKVLEENKIPNIFLKNKGAWNKSETLSFVLNDAGSRIATEGENICQIDTIDIDTLVGNDKVTFIKMDIEGSELKALEGAKETILKNKPRLAISIYHNPYDIIDIALYILELNPEYKLYLRHYASNMWETVLYAVSS